MKPGEVVMGNVAKQIIAGFTVVLLTLSAIIVLLLVRTNRFNKEYESILQNVLNLNTIKGVGAKAAADITNACIMGTSVEESGMLAGIDDMFLYLDELEESIGSAEEYQGNRSMVNSLRQMLVKYQESMEAVVALGDGTSFPAFNEEINKIVSGFKQIGNDMASYSNNNITMELERSAVIQKEIDENFKSTIYFALTAFMAILVVSVGICAWIVRSIVKPIRMLGKEIRLVAEGDLTKEEIRLPSKNEFNSLADAFNIMSRNLKDIISKVITATKDIADTAVVAEQTSNRNIKNSLEITCSAEDINTRMHEQSGEIEKIRNQMQEMKQISIQISEDIEKIDIRTKGSKNRAEEGNQSIAAFVEQLQQVNETVSQIAGAAETFGTNTQEVDKILDGISTISQQTKLLSLNASIEAARAGEAGRGFSVVAQEINILAERTVELVNAIAGIVESLEDSMKDMTSKMELGISQLDKGNTMAAQTQDKFREILKDAGQTNEEIRNVHRMVENFAQSAVDVADSMVEVGGIIEENTKMTERIVTTVEDQTESQKQLSSKVQMLDELVNGLTSTTSKFKVKAG
ncbi:methyl-accepting chemotaxis protein [Lachnospiraceae bacterium]|jgi:methyl-accepting chemotaxis protein|nr:methyl-accepting chemotaxis protein [Lachnospiraceae bacterium]